MTYKLLTLFCYCILIQPIYSQDCNYLMNKVDEFTKRVKKITKSQTILNKHDKEKTQNLTLSLIAIDSSKYLSISYYKRTSSGSFDMCFSDDSKLLVKLADSSIVSLPYVGSIECALSKVEVTQYSTYWNHSISGSFEMDSIAVAKLLSSEIRLVRVEGSKSYEDVKIIEKVKKPIGSFHIFGDKKIDPRKYFIDYMKCIQ